MTAEEFSEWVELQTAELAAMPDYKLSDDCGQTEAIRTALYQAFMKGVDFMNGVGVKELKRL